MSLGLARFLHRQGTRRVPHHRRQQEVFGGRLEEPHPVIRGTEPLSRGAVDVDWFLEAELGRGSAEDNARVFVTRGGGG